MTNRSARLGGALVAAVLAATCLTLTTAARPAAAGPAADRADRILMFGDTMGDSTNWPNVPGYALAGALRGRGYQVSDYTGRGNISIPPGENLADYGQVWHFAANYAFGDSLSPITVRHLIAYARTGGGLLLAGQGQGNAGNQAIVNALMAHPVQLDDVRGNTPQHINAGVLPAALLHRPCAGATLDQGNGRILGLVSPTSVLARTVRNSVRAAVWQASATRQHGPVALIMDDQFAGSVAYNGEMCAGRNLALFLSGQSAPPRP